MFIKIGWRLILCIILSGCGAERVQTGKEAADEASPAAPVVESDDLLEQYPEMIYEAPPVYPLLAVHSGIEGVVWVRALVGERGNVLEAAVEKSSGFPYLDDAALKAAMKCRYKSGMQQGIPVTCWVTYKVEFNLK